MSSFVRLLAVAAALALAGPAHAQSARPPLADRFPGEPRPAAQPPATPPAAGAEVAPRRSPPAPPRVVVCGGVFAKDSSHLKLATFFGSENLAWADVDGPERSKIKASVLYPRDPRRRLEVLWNLEASRSDTQVIVINGQSTWLAPKNLRLGLTLAALEKLNGRPFRLSGFDHENGGMVQNWDGGALATLPGGCQLGVRLAPDPKAPQPARSEVLGDKPFASNDPQMRAVQPKIVEILVGYPP
ncbi:MAG TPA: hypothetical protein VIH40_05835 [Xanthobacteraceae bacterium]